MIRDGLDRDSRAGQYALLVLDCWKREIERAVSEVKNSGRRSGLDKWFRRRWYIAQARDRKGMRSGSRYRALRGRGRTDDRLAGPGGSKDGRSQR